MLKLQPPLSIVPSGNDAYVMHCLCDSAETAYKFAVTKGADSERVLVADHSFYLATCDDAVFAHWLKSSMHEFDEARVSGVSVPHFENGRVELAQIQISEGSSSAEHQYRVILRANDQESSHIVAVREEVQDLVATWEFGFCKRTLSGFLRFAPDANLNPVLECVLRLYRAFNLKESPKHSP